MNPKSSIYAALSLALIMSQGTAWAGNKSGVDEDGNRFDPRCGYGRYDGPCIDIDLVNNEPPVYDECQKYIDKTAREHAACVLGVNEARNMATRYGGGYGRMHGFLRGFSWGMNKLTRVFENNDREINTGRAMVDTLNRYLQAGVDDGRAEGQNQGTSAGSAEARARFAAAMDTGRLPSDQIGAIPATSYSGEDNGYERHVRSPKTPQDFLNQDLAGMSSQLRAFEGLDNTYMGDIQRGTLRDYWFGDGIYQFETRRWMDKDVALSVWLQRPTASKPVYENLNNGAPVVSTQVPVIDPVTGKQQIDPATHKPMFKTVSQPINLQNVFRQSFVNSYGYYVSYEYSKNLYESMDRGQQAGEIVGIELGRRLAQQKGLISAFNERFKATSASSFRSSFASAYPVSFSSTYADYRDNPKLEVLFDGVSGANNDGIIQPGEPISARFRVRNFGGRGTALKVQLEGDVQGSQVFNEQISGLSSKPITTPAIARMDNRLQNGQSANIVLRVNSIEIPLQQVVKRQVQLAGATSAVDVIQGTAQVRVSVSNASTARSAGQVSVKAEIDGRVQTQIVGFLNAGESKDQVVEFQGLDPMALLNGSLKANITVTMNDSQMATSSVALAPADKRVDLVKYFDQVASGRGSLPPGIDRSSRVAELAAMIVSINDAECTDADSNPWKNDPNSTMLGLTVNQYKFADADRSDDGRKSFAQVGAELWKARKHFGKFLWIRSAKRKAYENLCQEMPIE